MIKHIPNLLTICNLICGCIAISFCFGGTLNYLITGSYFVYAAAIFDFFDGFAARVLKAYSPIGKQLDSLADMVTFGVAPSFFIFQIMNLALKNTNLETSLIINIAFLTAVFSALRLAKFNIDESQTTYFIGVPTPINGIMLVSFTSLIKMFHNTNIEQLILMPAFLIALLVASSLMMVAPLKMLSFKFANYSFASNKFRYFLIASAAIILLKYNVAGFTLVYLLYVLLSVLENMLEKKLHN